METRTHALIKVNKHLEDLRVKQSADTVSIQAEIQELKNEIGKTVFNLMDEKLSGIKSLIAELYPRNPKKQPIEGNATASGLVGSELRLLKSPDPHKFGEMEHVRSMSPPMSDHQAKTMGSFSRFSKIGFPSFDGTQLHDWLYKSEQYFMVENIAPETKVQLASIHFKGKTLK